MTRTAMTCALLALAAISRADDWPQWRGPAGNGYVPAKAAVPQQLPAAPKLIWKLPAGAGCASPVVAAGRVYYLDTQDSKETVHAVSADKGAELWKATLDQAYQDQQSDPGPRCTPTVDGDRVYVQSCLGEFQCLSTADGKVVWRTNFVKDYGAPVPAEAGPNLGSHRHGNTAAPLIDGDHIILTVGSTKGASLVCCDKRTGKEIWRSQNDPGGYCPPIVATFGGVRQYVAFTAEAVIGVKPADGALLWRLPVRTNFGRHSMTPIAFEDRVVVGSFTAGLIGAKVSKEGDGFKAERAWSSAAMAVNFSSPVAIGPYLYGMGPGNSLFCADIRTGEAAWQKQGFFNDMAHTGWASFAVLKGDSILSLTDEGHLLLLAAGPKDARTVSDVKVCAKNWCSPAYADGNLYLRDATEVKCVRLLP